MKMKWIDRVFCVFIAVAIWWMIWRPAWQEGWIRDLWHWLPGHIIVAVIFFNIGFLAAAILAAAGRADKQIRRAKNVVKLSERRFH